jgi:hypothetical protein
MAQIATQKLDVQDMSCGCNQLREIPVPMSRSRDLCKLGVVNTFYLLGLPYMTTYSIR